MATRVHKYQPVRKHLGEQRWSIPAAVLEINNILGRPGEITIGHLHYTSRGIVPPSPALREGLPILLGVPLEELFDADLLAREWSGHRDRYFGSGS